MRKHLPALFADAKPEGGTSSNLANIVDFARSSDDVIEPEKAKAILEGPEHATLIDVRTQKEYAARHAPGAKNVPLPDLAGGGATGLPEDKDAPIVTICKVGERSLYGMLLLKSLGYHHVTNVRGGLDAWVAAGLPTEPG
jgi:rhodanese-related sulfurtransferase